jgi:hypothetical protein
MTASCLVGVLLYDVDIRDQGVEDVVVDGTVHMVGWLMVVLQLAEHWPKLS